MTQGELMPVDPAIQTLLDNMAGADPVDLSSMTVEQARQVIGMLALVDGDPEPVAQVSDHTIPGPGGDIGLRVYQAAGTATPAPVLVWYHGGGWVIGDLASADPTARKLANRTGAVVVSVDYRLAPEHPFPAGPDDCWAALEWVAAHGAEIGGDPHRLAVGGDSAGGNLAALVAVRARDAGLTLRHQLLVYPATDLTMTSPSIGSNGEGYLLTATGMKWFGDHYLQGHDPTDPAVSPAYAASLSGLAPATVHTAEFDPLRDEGNAYAEALAEADVPCELICWPGMIHGFFAMATVTPVTNQAIDAASARVKAALA
jgi:acetyl esterase